MILLADLFGSKHLLGLLYVIVLNVVLFIVLRKKNIKEGQFVLIFTIVFFVLELMKIMYLWWGSTYPMNHLPFHLCSLPLYLMPLWLFAKEETKTREIAKAAVYGVVFMAGLIALLMPTNIIGSQDTWACVEDNYLPLVSFTYHGLMIFVPLYMLNNGFYEFKYKDVIKAFIPTLGLMVLAMVVNAILDKDFMLLNRGTGSPFKFLIETSKVLYIFSMIFLGFFIIHLNFAVTQLVLVIKNRINK